MQQSFNQLLDQYEFLCAQIDKQTQLLKQLAQLPLYRDRVKILCAIAGIGILTAMEILLELQDVSRFRRPEQLAAYVGLTPSQFSSADKIRMGRITGAVKRLQSSKLMNGAIMTMRYGQTCGCRKKQLGNAVIGSLSWRSFFGCFQTGFNRQVMLTNALSIFF